MLPANKFDIRYGEFPSYKGGPTIVYAGYIHEFYPGHPLQNVWGFVAQHRLVAEGKMNRHLCAGETVHHIDHNPLNNHPDNLLVMSKSEHQRHHCTLMAKEWKLPLESDQVSDALRKAGSIKGAAKLLGCCHTTLRNRFPNLTKEYQRRSPTKIDDPVAIAKVLEYAPDPNIQLRDVVRLTGMSAMTVLRICKRNGVEWKKKTRKGEKHRTYRGLPTKAGGHMIAPE